MADARAAPKLARDAGGERHEPSPVDLRAIAAAMALAAGGIAIAATVPWLVISHSAAPAHAPNDASKPAIARHAQATAPTTELAAYRRNMLQPQQTMQPKAFTAARRSRAAQTSTDITAAI